MNQKKNRHIDYSSYTRDPHVYIGFSDEESCNGPSLSKSHIIKENKKKNPLKEDITLIGKKRKNDNISSVSSKAHHSNVISVQQTTEHSQNINKKHEGIEQNKKMTPCENKKKQYIPNDENNKMNQSFMINDICNTTPLNVEKINFEKREDILLKQNLERFTNSLLKFFSQGKFSEKISGNAFFNKNYITSNIHKLEKLNKFVQDHGGIIEVVSKNLLGDFIKSFPNFYSNSIEVKADFDQYLSHFSLIAELKEKNLTENQILTELKLFDSSILVECPIFIATEIDSNDEVNTKIKEALGNDMAILKGFLRKFDIKGELFTIEYVSNHFDLKAMIEATEQDPKYTGFQTEATFHKFLQFGEFLKHTRNLDSKPLQDDTLHKKRNNNQKIHSAVHIQLTSLKELYSELETKVNPLILFGSSYDILAYVRQHIKGMTIPEMSIIVPNGWTSCHEENLAMRSVHVNHGPGIIKWWSIADNYSASFIEKVKDLHQISFYRKGTSIFPPIQFFMEHKIPVKSFTQMPGDIILTGPGTIYWNKAESLSVVTSWNFGIKDPITIERAIKWEEVNKCLHQRSVLPLGTLILDLLNHEMFDLRINFVKSCYDYISQIISQSKNEFEAIKEDLEKNSIGIFKEADHHIIESCENCLGEIFNYWGYCQACSKTREVILCVKCFQSHIKICPNLANLQFMFFKYQEVDLQKFIKRLDFKMKFHDELISHMKELKDIQSELLKITKDFKEIENKKIKKVALSDTILKGSCSNTYLFKDYSKTEISSYLIPLIDPDRFDEFYKPPIQTTDLDKLFDPYLEFDDIVDGINQTRFSPVHVPINKHQNDSSSIQDDNGINWATTGMSFLYEKEPKDLKATIYLSDKKDMQNDMLYGYLPGKSLVNLEYEVDEVHPLRPQSRHDSERGDTSYTKSLLPGPTPISPMQSLLKEAAQLRDLKSELYPNNCQRSVGEENQNNQGGLAFFGVFDFPISSKTDLHDKEFITEEIKKAKLLLKDLSDSQCSQQYKFFALDVHTNIYDGLTLIKRYIKYKDLLKEVKIKPFIEKIIRNSNLITAYRDLIKEEIYPYVKEL